MPSKSSKGRPSAYTKLVTVRILREQAAELDRLKKQASSSIIVRALLKLWMDNKIDADEAIAAEKLRTANAIAAINNSIAA